MHAVTWKSGASAPRETVENQALERPCSGSGFPNAPEFCGKKGSQPVSSPSLLGIPHMVFIY
jgi:hypothetical protein